MAWVFLAIACCTEVTGVCGLNVFVNQKKKRGLLVTIIAWSFGFYCIYMALQGIPMTITYTIWTGAGSAGSIVVGALLFKESMGRWKVFFLCMIVCGVVGLKLFAT